MDYLNLHFNKNKTISDTSKNNGFFSNGNDNSVLHPHINNGNSGSNNNSSNNNFGSNDIRTTNHELLGISTYNPSQSYTSQPSKYNPYSSNLSTNVIKRVRDYDNKQSITRIKKNANRLADYSGNYPIIRATAFTNPEITTKEIQKIHNEKLLARLKYYDRLLNKCFVKIRKSVSNDNTYCLFAVPEYVMGFPLYNTQQCIYYIMNKLKNNGFDSQYIPPNIMFISWYVKSPYEQIQDFYSKN